MPKESELRYLNPLEVERNSENPRIIFDEKKLNELLNSINEVGILVPLIAYYDSKKEKYILLDGERRLRCSKMLNLKKVPANIIATPNKIENILQMFNIHNVRIEWGPMEVAWKIKVLIKELGTDKERELSRLTSLKPSDIRKSKILLSFDKKYQDLVHEGPKNKGIKEDFLIELNPTLNWLKKELPEIDKNQLIDSLIVKHKSGVIDNYVKDFRNLSKLVRSGIKNKKIDNIFKKIMKDPKYSLNQAYEVSIKYKMDSNEIEKRVKKLLTLLADFKIKDGEDMVNVKKILMKLHSLIGKILGI